MGEPKARDHKRRGRWARRLLPTGAALAGALFGCETRDEAWGDELNLQNPSTAGGHLVVEARGRDSLLVIDPATASPRFIPLAAELRPPVARLESNALLAFESDGATLLQVDLETDRSTRYPLGGRFDALTQTPDGAYAILTRGGGGSGLVNASEVALIALDEGPGPANPARRGLSSKGGTIRGVDVSPAYGAAGRRLALFRSASHLAAVPVEDFAAGTLRTIPLAADGDPAVTPVESVFRESVDHLDVFVRADSGSDIIHLRFPDADDGIARPVLNQLTAGGLLSSILLLSPDGPLGAQIVALSRSSRGFTLIDPETAESKYYPVDDAPADGLVIEGVTGEELVLYTLGRNVLHRVALSELPTKKTKAIKTTSLGAPILDVTAAAGGTRLVILHSDTGGPDITLLDPVTGEVVPFTTSDTLVGTALSDDLTDLVVLTRGTTQRLTTLDIASGTTLETEVASSITAMLPIAGTSTVALLSADGLGTFAFYDATDVTKAPKRLESAGWLSILDQEAER